MILMMMEIEIRCISVIVFFLLMVMLLMGGLFRCRFFGGILYLLFVSFRILFCGLLRIGFFIV